MCDGRRGKTVGLACNEIEVQRLVPCDPGEVSGRGVSLEVCGVIEAYY